MKTYSIALIPGDGIGKDVAEAAWQVLQAAAKRGGFTLDGTSFPWSCAYYLETGTMMPPRIDMLHHRSIACRMADLVRCDDARAPGREACCGRSDVGGRVRNRAGLGTIAGKDRTETILRAVLAALS